jgi:hypothetical protein
MRYKIFILSLSFSFILHALIFFSLSVYIKGKGNPLIWCWFDILSEEEIERDEKIKYLPSWVFISYNFKDYLPFFIFKEAISLSKYNKSQPVFSLFERKIFLKKEKQYLYLWERPSLVEKEKREDISYSLFVSPYGKVISIYPQKLPLDSSKNLYFETYIREACMFLKDKFFWTKIKEVVK